MTGDKWIPYVTLVNKEKIKQKKVVSNDLDIDYINLADGESIKKTIEGEVLDKLGLHKYCCRRMFLGNVNLISYI
tara:strand:- start:193 stop:417 length:225 start_codon:yes stop_codon:yes gene_type:complete